MSRYHIFVETVGGGKKVKVGETEYLSDAITRINQLKVIHVEERKYCRAVVHDSTNLDRVSYEERW